MSASTLIEACRQRGVELLVDGERLRWRPDPALTDELREQLRARKFEVISLLRGASTPRVEVHRPSSRPVAATTATVPEPATDGRPVSRCYCCRGREYMRVSTGPCWVCTTCHPPLPFVEVLERWTVGGGA